MKNVEPGPIKKVYYKFVLNKEKSILTNWYDHEILAFKAVATNTHLWVNYVSHIKQKLQNHLKENNFNYNVRCYEFGASKKIQHRRLYFYIEPPFSGKSLLANKKLAILEIKKVLK